LQVSFGAFAVLVVILTFAYYFSPHSSLLWRNALCIYVQQVFSWSINNGAGSLKIFIFIFFCLYYSGQTARIVP
jgi:hypothetical protein